jgi:hypothetical protein
MNPWSHTIEALAASVSSIARRAVEEYAPIVNAIVSERSQNIRHIKQTLDGLLDFCFDPEALLLYKKLCRHYYAIDPAAAAGYVNAYREMWDSGPKAQT